MKMNRFGKWCLVVMCAVGLSAVMLSFVTTVQADQNTDNQKVIDAFVASVGQDNSLDEKTKSEIIDEVKSLASDPYTRVESVSVGLTKLFPKYAEALDVAAEMDSTSAIAALQPFVDSDNPFLAADASFFLARTYMSDQQFENATPILEALVKNHSEHSLQAGNAMYFQGLAYAGTLQPEKSIAAFSEFLQGSPDAPERMRVSAWRKIQELQSIEAGKLTDVHQHMNYSKRRLEIENTDKQTQKEQAEIIKMLATLIKEQEKKECSNSKGSKNCKNPGESESQQQAQSQGQGQGESNTGGGSKNPNGIAKRQYNNGPPSPWSELRERMRDPANAAIQSKLPARYRNVIDKFHERINKDLSGSSDR
jgi:tetratricopeptide (TPR) repeat protein